LATGGASGGTVTQPARITSAAESAARAECERRSPNAMEWIILEALVALLLAVIIVWWTMGPKRGKPSREAPDDSGNRP
jgi:hypothetical protein